jgi:hypothetical protein
MPVWRRWRLLEGGVVDVEGKTNKAGLYAGKNGRRGCRCASERLLEITQPEIEYNFAL